MCLTGYNFHLSSDSSIWDLTWLRLKVILEHEFSHYTSLTNIARMFNIILRMFVFSAYGLRKSIGLTLILVIIVLDAKQLEIWDMHHFDNLTYHIIVYLFVSARFLLIFFPKQVGNVKINNSS